MYFKAKEENIGSLADSNEIVYMKLFLGERTPATSKTFINTLIINMINH